MKKAMIFNLYEFEELVSEVTYGVMGFYNTMNDGWYWMITMNDDDWEEFADTYGKDAKKELDKFAFDELENGDFAYSMIGKRFDAIVEEIVIDFYNERVAVIFE